MHKGHKVKATQASTDRWMDKQNVCVYMYICSVMLSSVQSLSRVWLFVTPWTAAYQASLSITNSQSLLKLMSIESVMPSSYLILCRPLLPASGSFPMSQLFAWGGQSNVIGLKIEWIFAYGTTWMNLEDIMLCETTQSQRTNMVCFLLYEVPRVARFVERESRMVVAKGRGGGRMGSYL